MRKNFVAAVAVASLMSVSCGLWAQKIPPGVKAAEDSIDGEHIRAHVRFLADDLLEGRGPGLRGRELAAKYIATQFALYGLKPAGDEGTYLQQIDFVGMKVIPAETSFRWWRKERADVHRSVPIDLTYGDDYTVSNQTDADGGH